MSTVRKTLGLACPKCGCDEALEISVPIWVDVFPDGTFERFGSSHEWDQSSPCRCTQCKQSGTVADFTVENGGAS